MDHVTISEKYQRVRNASEEICSKLKTEDYLAQPVPWVSPPKWHLGHTTWFFETFLLKQVEGYHAFNDDYNFLFNSYYETIGKRVNRNSRGILFRPAISEIYQYRRHVDDAMVKFLLSSPGPAIENIVDLGLQHEQQHQELLITDTKYIFSQHPLLPVWDEGKTLAAFRQQAEHGWLDVPAGVYEVGFEGEGFCFDNELGVHKQYIQDLKLMDRPVTNGEFLEFINAGGYSDFRFWLSEGWDWVSLNSIAHPMHWHFVDGKWYFYHLDGLQTLDPALPLMHVSYFEADAFARWKGLRLPTEFEWETAARRYPHAFQDLVWEWTQSAYLPYPGFRIAEGAIGEYNGKFMINQMVLRGGSIATPEGHSRVTYRNFFHPQMQWQFSGIRLAVDVLGDT